LGFARPGAGGTKPGNRPGGARRRRSAHGAGERRHRPLSPSHTACRAL